MGRGPASVLVDSGGNLVGVVEDDGSYRLEVREFAQVEQRRDERFVFYDETFSTAGPSYVRLLDLDNSSGFYKHDGAATSILLSGLSGQVERTRSQDAWLVRTGAIVSQTASDGTVGWIPEFLVSSRDTAFLSEELDVSMWPRVVSLKSTAGSYDKIASNDYEVMAGLGTGNSVPDAGGTSAAPAVGDLVMEVTRESGNQDLLVDFQLSYFVEIP